MLNATQIRTAKGLTKEVVHVPEWASELNLPPDQCVVCVRAMPVGKKEEIQCVAVSLSEAERGSELWKQLYRDFNSKVAVACLCDENGVLLLGPTDVPEFRLKDSSVVQRISDVGLRLSGMGDKASESRDEEKKE